MDAKTTRFFVPGPLPGLNEHEAAARAHKMAAATLKKKWTKVTAECILFDCQNNWAHFKDSVHVVFEWCEESRRRDPDNICFAKKYILDGMVLSGMIKNDGWKQIFSMRDEFRIDKRNPGCWVTVMEV